MKTVDSIENMVEEQSDWTDEADVTEHSDYQLGDAENSTDMVESSENGGELVEQQQAPEDVSEFDAMLDKDFREARDNILDIAAQGKEVLREMVEIAKHSDHPRAYEVVGELMRKMSEINKDLMSLYSDRNKNVKEIRSLEGKNKEGSGQQQTNNIDKAVFLGSTKDLQDYLEGADRDKDGGD